MNFKLSDNDAAGTSLQGYVDVPPSLLMEKFGDPSGGSDGYKVSGEYVFESEDGEIFTLYDYKSTTLYDSDNPDPDMFWNSRMSYQFHIGGTNPEGVETFKEWLLKEIGDFKTNLIQMELRINVIYDPGTTDLEELRRNLEYVARHAAGDGWFTGDSDAEVDQWDYEVIEF